MCQSLCVYSVPLWPTLLSPALSSLSSVSPALRLCHLLQNLHPLRVLPSLRSGFCLRCERRGHHHIHLSQKRLEVLYLSSEPVTHPIIHTISRMQGCPPSVLTPVLEAFSFCQTYTHPPTHTHALTAGSVPFIASVAISVGGLPTLESICLCQTGNLHADPP